MPSIEDQYLLEKLKEDDIRALETIFNRYYSDLCRYLLLIFKNQLLVEHVAQDIFIYFWENRKKLEINTSLRSYLFNACKYKALNQIRNYKRREKIKDDIISRQHNHDNSNILMIEISELERVIEDAVSTLPNRCQQIFRLSREEDMSYKEIAKLLNISLNTVENQMTIALKKLRILLRPFYYTLFLSV